MKITLSRAAFIAAASVVQANQDIRYYLNGILIEKGPDDHPLVVATDGHRLVAALDENGLCSDDMPDSVIIQFSAETLRAAKLVKNLDNGLQIEAAKPDNETDQTPIVTVQFWHDARKPGFGVQTSDSKLIDGTFPDWRRCLVNAKGKAAGWYNAAYIADFEKVGRFLSENRRRAFTQMTIRSDGPELAAAIRFGGLEYAFGILMPMRADAELPGLPVWAVGPSKKDKAA